MTRTLDWKWIGIGVVIMIVLNIVAGVVLGIFLRDEISEATQIDDVRLSAGQMAALALLNFLVFAIGGFIVGWKSAGRTILEPGISAALAVVIALALANDFTIGNILASGLMPFAAGVLGGWFGERRQQAAG